MHRLIPVALLLLTFCSLQVLADEPPRSSVTSDSSLSPMSLAEIIEAVQREEARLVHYSASLKHTIIYPPSSGYAFESSREQIVDGLRFKLTVGDTIKVTDDETLNGQRQIVSDGTKTIAIEEDNCVVEYSSRSEPAQFVPPHSWGLFDQKIQIPLSVLLGGRDAVEAHLAARGQLAGLHRTFQLSRLEVALLAGRQLEQLDCEVVRIKRQISGDATEVLYVWLARNRNWQIARVKACQESNGHELPVSITEVEKWRKVGSDIWIPRLLEAFVIQPKGDPTLSQRLIVEAAELTPHVSDKTFAWPAETASLPRFAVDDAGSLVNSPHHPAGPLQPPSTTFDVIVGQLAEEERKYKPLEMDLRTRSDFLNPRVGTAGEVFEMQEHTIEAGPRHYRDAVTSRLNPPGTFAHQRAYPNNALDYSVPLNYWRDANDGQTYRRYVSLRSTQTDEFTESATIDRSGTTSALKRRSAHSFLFAEALPENSLAEFLRHRWHDEAAGHQQQVTYDGDELVDGLVCHRLTGRIEKLLPSTPATYYIVWLARDRNLLPIRREWHDAGLHPRVPAVISYSEDLREIAPGQWFSFRSSTLTFQKAGFNALPANRLGLADRVDTTVKAVSIKQDVALDRFAEVLVPKDVPVAVIEKDRKSWTFAQPQDGHLDVAENKRASAINR